MTGLTALRRRCYIEPLLTPCIRAHSCVGPDSAPTYFGDSAGEERSWLSKTDLIYLKKIGSTTEVDKDNIIPATVEHLPKDIRQMLEERKKKHDEEDLKVALASIKVDRRGKVTKMHLPRRYPM